MDCNMPVMDGYDATRILREKMSSGVLPSTPIYSLTAGNDRSPELKRSMDAGVEAVINKPITPKKLKEIVEKHCNSPKNQI
mmetsp:Transcript_7613/g.6903  ORF Transcript_7613/g.6903 Transcript_7613/m.6903 type:complete len:81 (-) Transcript_7613:99-341(-)